MVHIARQGFIQDFSLRTRWGEETGAPSNLKPKILAQLRQDATTAQSCFYPHYSVAMVSTVGPSFNYRLSTGVGGTLAYVRMTH